MRKEKMFELFEVLLKELGNNYSVSLRHDSGTLEDFFVIQITHLILRNNKPITVKTKIVDYGCGLETEASFYEDFGPNNEYLKLIDLKIFRKNITNFKALLDGIV